MLLDLQNLFSDAQSLSGNALATNVIDLAVARAIGNGEEMEVLFEVDVAADQGTGDETYQFDVEYASDAGQTTARRLVGRRIFQAGTPTAPNEDADLLVAGFKFAIPVPATAVGSGLTSEANRYLGVRYVLSGTTPTLTVTAHLQPAAMGEVAQPIYPKGYTVS